MHFDQSVQQLLSSPAPDAPEEYKKPVVLEWDTAQEGPTWAALAQSRQPAGPSMGSAIHHRCAYALL